MRPILSLTLVLGWNRYCGTVPGERHHWWLPVLLLLTALVPVATTPMINRGLRAEPEPMDSADSPQFSAAYAKLRATKAKGLFMLSLVMALALLTVAVISVAMHLDNKQLGGARRRLRHFGGHRRCNLRGGDGQPPHAYQSLVERIQSLVKRCSSSDMRPAILRWKMFLDSELVSNRTIHVVRVRKVMTAFLVAQAASL